MEIAVSSAASGTQLVLVLHWGYLSKIEFVRVIFFRIVSIFSHEGSVIHLGGSGPIVLSLIIGLSAVEGEFWGFCAAPPIFFLKFFSFFTIFFLLLFGIFCKIWISVYIKASRPKKTTLKIKWQRKIIFSLHPSYLALN